MQYNRQGNKMKYKVTNPFEQDIKVGDITFQPHETKILDYGISGFNIEEIEQEEKPKKLKGGKK
jgi:hypothetical protein